jgi:hypothetical protein
MKAARCASVRPGWVVLGVVLVAARGAVVGDRANGVDVGAALSARWVLSLVGGAGAHDALVVSDEHGGDQA